MAKERSESRVLLIRVGEESVASPRPKECGRNLAWTLALSLSLSSAISYIFLGAVVVTEQNECWELGTLQDRTLYTVLAVSCAVGGIVGGKISDSLGSTRQILVFCTSVSSLSTLGGALAPNFTWFIISTVLMGAMVGASTVLSLCLYLENIPKTRRSFHLLTLTSATYIINLTICFISYFCLHTTNWRWRYIIVGIPTILSSIILFFLIDKHLQDQPYVSRHTDTVVQEATQSSGAPLELDDIAVDTADTSETLLTRYFRATLALATLGFVISSLTTMTTFTLPIMVENNFCNVRHLLVPDSGSKFECIVLTVVYMSFLFGACLVHILKNKPRKASLYILLALNLVSLIPQMQCISPGLLVGAVLLTLITVGGVIHLFNFMLLEVYPNNMRVVAVGIIYTGVFLGKLYGPYVDFLVHFGTIKSVYAVFYVLSATVAILFYKVTIDDISNIRDTTMSYRVGEETVVNS